MSTQQDISRSDRRAERGSGTYGHLAPLLRELVRSDRIGVCRRSTRDALVAGFRPVAQHRARRYAGRGEPVDDLEQVGMLGLLSALDRFAPRDDVDDLVGAFLGYAIPTITGEICHHFRDTAWTMRVPRRLKDLQGPIRDAVHTLSGELRRSPRPSEIAAYIGVDVREVIEALGAQQAHTLTSTDALADAGRTAPLDAIALPDAALDLVEHSQALRRGLDALSDRDRTMLLLRFYGDMTQTQIGHEVGLSQMHVSRMLSRALGTLRRSMDAASETRSDRRSGRS